MLNISELLFHSCLQERCVLNHSSAPDFVLGIGEAGRVDLKKNLRLHEAYILVGGVRQ